MTSVNGFRIPSVAATFTERRPWSEFAVILLDRQLPDGIADTIL